MINHIIRQSEEYINGVVLASQTLGVSQVLDGVGTFLIAKVWSAGKRVSAIEGCYIEEFVKDTMIP